jgi:glucokinase
MPSAEQVDDMILWEQALKARDGHATQALAQFCRSFGSVAGDIALMQGGTAVVLAGGIGLRLTDHLPRSGFVSRFTAKGRLSEVMARIPVTVLVHPQPGLYGVASAFAKQFA